jgi:hypothetical protein
MSSIERRRYARAPIQSRATLLRDQVPLGSFDVVNLAAGGLLLAGNAPVAAGTTIEVALSFDDGPAVVIAADMLRERARPQGACFALAFRDAPADLAARIAARVDQLLVQARRAHVLVIDPGMAPAMAGSQLRIQLARIGHTAHTVASPLDALHLLGQENRIGIAIVALPSEADQKKQRAETLDLLAHLADQHPYLRRILLSERAADAELSAALRQRPQAAPHEILASPWNDAALARAVSGG